MECERFFGRIPAKKRKPTKTGSRKKRIKAAPHVPKLNPKPPVEMRLWSSFSKEEKDRVTKAVEVACAQIIPPNAGNAYITWLADFEGHASVTDAAAAASAVHARQKALDDAKTKSAACALRVRRVKSMQILLELHDLLHPPCACPHTSECGRTSSHICVTCRVFMCSDCALAHVVARGFGLHRITSAGIENDRGAKRIKMEPGVAH
jgi:hypothetical protein